MGPALGFRPEDLTVPVDVWAGEQDQLITHTGCRNSPAASPAQAC